MSTLQGAMLGLLALLLGFSFARVAERFSQRTKLIAEEANAIGTAWFRCDLLPEAQRLEARRLLLRYTEQRIAFYDAPDRPTQQAAAAESEALQTRLWALAAGAANERPTVAEVLWPPFNRLFELHNTRMAAAQRHLPRMLLLLLLACSLVSVAAVGYGCGLAEQRNPVLTTALVFLVAGVLWAIIDMDHPRKGLIRAGQQPMLELRRVLSR